MPEVLRVDGFVFTIFLPPREHGPAHVHVRSASGVVIVMLNPVSVRSVTRRVADGDVVRVVRLVEAHVDHLRAEWRKHHG